MKVTRLRLEQFRRFLQPLEIQDLQEGLNLFTAPNEAGKSTVALALRAAFLERYRSTSVDSLRPWGHASASPAVEVDFEFNGVSYRLRKSFLTRRRCDLQVNGQSSDGEAAEDQLARLMGFTFAGRGANRDENLGVPGLLWIRQGTSQDLAGPLQHAEQHLQSVLQAAVGGVASTQGDEVLERLEQARHELLTPAGQAPRGEYAKALEELKAIDTRRAETAEQLAQYQRQVDELANLSRQHRLDELERPWDDLRARCDRAQAALDGSRRLQADLQAQEQAVRHHQTLLSALRAQCEGFEREAAARQSRQQALVAAEQARLQAQQACQIALGQADAAQQALEAAQAQLALASRQRERQAALARVTELRGLTEAVNRSRDQAREAQARVEQLRLQTARLAIPTGVLAQLQSLDEQWRRVQAQLEAAATTLVFDLEAQAQATLEGVPVDPQARHTLTQRAVLEIQGLGRIAVHPGGTEIPTLRRQVETLQRERAQRLAALGVEDLAQALVRQTQAEQQQTELKGAEALLRSHAPQGLAALEAQALEHSAALEAAQRHLDHLDPGPLGAVSAEADGFHGDGVDLAQKVEHARQTHARLVQQLQEARVAEAAAVMAHQAAQREWAALESLAADAQHLAVQMDARTQLTDAIAREPVLLSRLSQLQQQVQAARIDALELDVRRLQEALRQSQEIHAHRATAIARLESELVALGAMGLEERAALELQQQLRQQRRVKELGDRAAALDHLVQRLRHHRAQLAQRLRAPLQARLKHYLDIVFPGVALEIGDDLSPRQITRLGPHGPQSGAFEEFSVGAREQIGIMARLAYADLLAQAGRPTLLILDDALVHSDEDRLEQMKRVLFDAAQRHQVLIFTCHPKAWRDLGVVARALPAP